MKPDASEKQSEIEVDVSEYVAADQNNSDGDDGFGNFVQSRAENPLPPVAIQLSVDKKDKRLSKVEASTSDETETRKRSRSTSSLKNESDSQPIKQSRGRSSSRICANDTPAFLHDPDVMANLPESENGKVNLNSIDP